MNNNCNCNCTKNKGKGRSSFYIHDSNIVFDNLSIKGNDIILDLGCGAGDYALYAAKTISDNGKVIIVDLKESIVNQVYEKAKSQNINNIIPMTANITEPINIDDNSIDLCMLFTVLHSIQDMEKRQNIYKSVRKMLKPNSSFAIMECEKKETNIGPPLKMRISREELQTEVEECGFKKIKTVALGVCYLMIFSNEKR